MGGKAGTKEDAVWCSLVFTVNCREIQQVCSRLWMDCKEEPFLWVVRERAEVFYLLTPSHLLFPTGQAPPLGELFPHTSGLCHLTPQQPLRKSDTSPTEGCFVKAKGRWSVERGWGIYQDRRQQLIEMWGRAHTTNVSQCRGSCRAEHCGAHPMRVSDLMT